MIDILRLLPFTLALAILAQAELRAEEPTWWSLRPLEPQLPPSLTDQAAVAWVRTPVDAFVLAKLREEGLAPAPEADRRTLFRRLYFDLIGLPPAPDEVDTFLGDTDPRAYERLVDRLLASPQYGEKWARHWLDLARYADTHGYDKDKLRPHAWPYRDYVIRSLNADKPYGEFVREQIAGDVLDGGLHSPKAALEPPIPAGGSGTLSAQVSHQADGIVATGFLAAGPFDWVGHIEVAEGTVEKDRVRSLDRDEMVAAVMNVFCSTTVQCARCHDHKFDPISQRDYYALQAVFAGIDRANRPYGTHADGSQRLVFAAATDFPDEGNHRPTRGTPRPIFLLARGDVQARGEQVAPGGLGCLDSLAEHFELPPEHAEGRRRAALAAWITDPGNPLTWRSIVNRVWQHHFGRGIVATPSDFGRMGAAPTHPVLLDWLAAEFRDGGTAIHAPQSLKDLHRLLVTSSTYRQSSAYNDNYAAIDAENRYLWRMPRRRLAAEEIRDAVLSVAGRLDRTMYGPPFQAFAIEKPEHSPHYLYEKHNVDDPASHRRSIYRFIVRSVPDPLFAALDCADASQSVPIRDETLTPASALAMLNDAFVVRMSEHFAARVGATDANKTEPVRLAFEFAVGRIPVDEELQALSTLAENHGLAAACRTIFNLNEFMFVD